MDIVTKCTLQPHQCGAASQAQARGDAAEGIRTGTGSAAGECLKRRGGALDADAQEHVGRLRRLRQRCALGMA